MASPQKESPSAIEGPRNFLVSPIVPLLRAGIGTFAVSLAWLPGGHRASSLTPLLMVMSYVILPCLQEFAFQNGHVSGRRGR